MALFRTGPSAAPKTPDERGVRGEDAPRPSRLATRSRSVSSRASPFRNRTVASVTAFKNPQDCFAALDPQTVASLVASASDLAIVVDSAGTVRDLSVPNRELASKLGEPEAWIGQSWVQLLNQNSRAKAALFLADAVAGRTGKWHHFNHLSRDGADVPVLYAAGALGADGRLLLFGRDLRPLSLLQQRLIDAQNVMERDHNRLRQLELRYRLMLQTSTDALLVVNAASQKIVEGNAVFSALIGAAPEALGGQPVLDLFAPIDRPRIQTMLVSARAAAPHEALVVTLSDGTAVTLAATLFHDEGASYLLLRIHPETSVAVARLDGPEQPALLRLLEHAPDGYVVTDAQGRVLSANAAFQAMAEAPRPRDMVGQPLDRWLGRGGADLDVLLNNTRQRGTVRLFASAMTGSSGLSTAVEVSAVGLAGATDGAAFGFAVRDVERRVTESRAGRDLPRSVDQLTELIGRVSLKDLVREATDMIERLCIEAALEMTRDNRASAAELLGLSRQSLYVKLHRYGLGDLADVPS